MPPEPTSHRNHRRRVKGVSLFATGTQATQLQSEGFSHRNHATRTMRGQPNLYYATRTPPPESSPPEPQATGTSESLPQDSLSHWNLNATGTTFPLSLVSQALGSYLYAAEAGETSTVHHLRARRHSRSTSVEAWDPGHCMELLPQFSRQSHSHRSPMQGQQYYPKQSPPVPERTEFWLRELVN